MTHEWYRYGPFCRMLGVRWVNFDSRILTWTDSDLDGREGQLGTYLMRIRSGFYWCMNPLPLEIKIHELLIQSCGTCKGKTTTCVWAAQKAPTWNTPLRVWNQPFIYQLPYPPREHCSDWGPRTLKSLNNFVQSNSQSCKASQKDNHSTPVPSLWQNSFLEVNRLPR